MPLYEYECESCGSRFERIQKFSDPPVAVCPKCGGPVRKLISSPAIQFKGSGFYITDYPKAGSADKSGSAGKPSSEKGSGAKGDASPASTSDSSSSTSESKSSESKSGDTAPAKATKTGSE
jgi:putative FmdB family regulatory protein